MILSSINVEYLICTAFPEQRKYVLNCLITFAESTEKVGIEPPSVFYYRP